MLIINTHAFTYIPDQHWFVFDMEPLNVFLHAKEYLC